jgi:CTP:molybdopterin cytidylyltransferase MocA
VISSIVLAAGLSSRMGSPKALLDWGGQPLLRYQIEQLHEGGADEVIVVLGYRADDISRKIRGVQCRIMLNPRYHMGRAGTLRIGAKAVNRDAESIVILNVDQPRPASFVREMIEAHRTGGRLITRPTFDGHGGHPIVVAGSLRPELMEATDDSEGLRGVLARHMGDTHSVPADAICRLDVNTPEDYVAARPATTQA